MVQSETAADKACVLLRNEGFLVKARPVYRSVGSDENYFELLALRSEAQEARKFLLENNIR
jgi:hypothetical protein